MKVGYETIDWEKPEFVGQHGYISHDKDEVKRIIKEVVDENPHLISCEATCVHEEGAKRIPNE